MSAISQPALFTRLGFDPAYLPTFEDKLFIEGPQTARRLTNFFALLLFATVIATYGVLSNSTATVIGAMIVAPLMGPIMATTSAVVMGSFPRALRAFALTVAGQNVMSAEDNTNATVKVQQWLKGTSYQVEMVNVNNRVVTVTVEGTGGMKPLHQLANQLAVALGRPVLVNLLTLPA